MSIKIYYFLRIRTDNKVMNVIDFTNRLTLCIKEKGMSRTAFGKDFGISEATIRNWIRNGNFPSVEIVYKMAKYFGVPMEYLINGTESKLDDADFMLLLKIKKLSAEQKKMLAAVADSLINQKE